MSDRRRKKTQARKRQSTSNGNSPFRNRSLAIAGAITLAFAALAGRAYYPAKSPVTLADYTVEREGDPHVGTVYWYKQLHGHPTQGSAPASIDRENEFNSVLEQQYAILNELNRLNAQYIVTEQVPTAKYIKEVLPINRSLTGRLFSGGVPQTLTNAQKNNLYHFGAGIVYGGIHPQVTFIPHNDPDLGQRVEALLQRLPTMPYQEYTSCRTYNLIHVDRENALADSICTTLAEHPGTFIAVVYGKEHTQFPARFEGKCNPRVYSRFFVTPAVEKAVSKPRYLILVGPDGREVERVQMDDPWKHCYSASTK